MKTYAPSASSVSVVHGPSSPPYRSDTGITIPTSVESMPLPLPNTPSTTFSYPPRSAPGGAHKAQSSIGHSTTATAATTTLRDHHSHAHPYSHAHSHSQMRTAAASRRHYEDTGKRSRDAKEDANAFDEHALPTKEQLRDAAALTVVAQNGVRVAFGDLFKDRKTIVIFIRHFWQVLFCFGSSVCIATNGAVIGARTARTTCTPSRGSWITRV